MKYKLQDLIDMEHFQNLQDRLNEIYSFPSSIIDNDGNILTATAWQDICTQFHRKNKDCEKLCIKSDQYIKDHIHEANPAVSYRCPHGLVDNATPIIIEGIHYGNYFTGQFFLEAPDLEFFRAQAQKYGFDEDAYLMAVKRVPIWTPEQLKNYLFFIKGLIAVISESGLKKLKEMEHRKLIEDSEKRHRSILRSAMDGYWLTDTDGRLIEVNDAYCRMSGYSEDELLTLRIPSLEVVETPRLVAEHMQKIAIQGSDRFESKHRRKDGTIFDVEISIQFRSEENGQCVCFIRDITDRRQAEDALKESELFLENMSDIAYRADNQGNLVWVNSAGERVTGFSRNDLIRKPFLPLFIEADRPSLIDVYKRTLMGESLENTLTFKSGVTCHFTSLPRRSENGDIVGTFGVARDITAQLDAQRALQRSEARLKKAQETAKIGNWEYDITTGKVWGSEEAFRIYGIERTSEFLPLDEIESCILDAKKVNQALVDLVTKKKVYDIEYEINSKGRAGLTLIHSKADLIFGADGNPVKVHGVIQDITERKRAEKEKEDLEARLRQALKMEAVGRLAGGVAHDFNNMLSVIIGHADMAMEGVDPAQALYANLEQIKNAGERSADLTRQLLAFARKQTVAPKVLDLNKTVGGMTRMLQRLIGEDIDLAWRPCENLWPVKMDPSQIDQILANLCVNARDAIADVGKITIETGNAEFDEPYCNDHLGFLPGEYVLLAVSDNGCGMDAETLGNIFEPFFTTKESGKGTGLGLATVYGVVKQNEGFINVYSEPDQGTTFRIYLPRHLTKTPHLSEKEVYPPRGRGHETILLVEDELAILRMTTMMLERLGYAVLAARTPGEAIRLAHQYTGMIDLLVTDVVMPEMNGRDLAKNILSFYPNLKRLFMSGYTANVIAHHGVLDEGVNFIQKPFSRENLGAKVREALDEDKP
ncbi:MAG: PocR ligand-binding domain-containing protein [Pseudomonadota bacterium]